MRSWGLIATGCLLAWAQPATAEHLAPRDECSRLPGVDQFRMVLVTAIANRNVEMLEPLVDPRIDLDFGGGFGWDLMRERLQSDERELWAKLEETVSLGCGTYSDTEFAFPWLWTQDLGTDDPFSAFVTLGSDVPLRSEPRKDAPIVRGLNWEVVTLTGPYNLDQNYLTVTTRTGDDGYVLFEQLRSELDYRLIVVRDEATQEWRIKAFIAGD